MIINDIRVRYKNMTNCDMIEDIIHYDTNNIIEFIDRYIWFYCSSGYSLIENNIISKSCVWDDKNNIRCSTCRRFKLFSGRFMEGLVTTNLSKDGRYHVFVKHNFSFIIDSGIII